MNEWRIINGWPQYAVNECGEIRSLPRIGIDSIGRRKFYHGRTLKPQNVGRGYLKILLTSGQRREQHLVHRLVACAFIANPENKPQVNHIDGDKTNNHVSNLEWVTQSENMLHGNLIGIRRDRGASNGNALLTTEQSVEIRQNNDGLTQQQLADMFGVSRTTISRIQNGKRYVIK